MTSYNDLTPEQLIALLYESIIEVQAERLMSAIIDSTGNLFHEEVL